MQHAYEDLDRQVLGARDDRHIKFNMKVDNSVDERVCDERAEFHTKPQLEMLTNTLRYKRNQCKNKDIREAFDEALRPLEARQARYDAIRKAAEDLRLKQQKAREEQEFRDMMAGWVVGVDGEAVEQSFAGIANWHVENSNARDCARERWRLRKRHKDRLKAARLLPQPLKFVAQQFLSVITPIALRTKFKEELPEDVLEDRADDLVDVLWDWQGEVDVALCDAFGVEAFEDLPEAVQDVDLSVLFIAGRNNERRLTFASPNLCFDDFETNSRPWTPTPSGQRSELSLKRREMLREHLLLQNSVKRHVEDIEIKMRCDALIEDIVYKLSEIDEQGFTTSSIGQGGRGYERPQTLGRPQTSKYEWVWNIVALKSLFGRNNRKYRKGDSFHFGKGGIVLKSSSSKRVAPESVDEVFPPNPNDNVNDTTPIKPQAQARPSKEDSQNVLEQSQGMEVQDIEQEDSEEQHPESSSQSFDGQMSQTSSNALGYSNEDEDDDQDNDFDNRSRRQKFKDEKGISPIGGDQVLSDGGVSKNILSEPSLDKKHKRMSTNSVGTSSVESMGSHDVMKRVSFSDSASR